jgi:Ca2+/Na+ antiporter
LEEDELVEENFWRPPSGVLSRLVYVMTFPLTALVHLTTPDSRRPGCSEYYPLTLAMSLVWLVVLATVMSMCLDALGCLIGLSSTVMGLTLGAIGTSFPNLFASVLSAQQGEAGMAVVQAFASNVFNVCVALGLLWLVQALGGACDYGAGVGSCGGCFLPDGVTQMPCPNGAVVGDATQSGSLRGTVLFTAVCVVGITMTIALSGGRITTLPALAMLATYALYATYEVLAARNVVLPICFGDVCF